jgi:acyl-CoA dehydrogenase
VSTSSSDVDRLLQESVSGLFGRHSNLSHVRELSSGGWMPELWSIVEEAELPLLPVTEAAGGSGGSVGQWAISLRTAARHCAPIPLAETGVAGWLLEQAGIAVPEGALTVAGTPAAEGENVTIETVPYARHVGRIVVAMVGSDVCEVATLSRDHYDITESVNLAGEPRDTIRFAIADLDDRRPGPASLEGDLRLRWALVRSIQIAGALDALLNMTLQYTRERVQFGTALARLPVIRERLALLAEAVAAAGAAVECAVDGLTAGDPIAVGAAKIRTGEAAGEGARLGHQIHGAIGMTREHPLHLLTTRLWSWREEAGNERWWAERIGRAIAESGPAQLWPTLVSAGGMPTG